MNSKINFAVESRQLLMGDEQMIKVNGDMIEIQTQPVSYSIYKLKK